MAETPVDDPADPVLAVEQLSVAYGDRTVLDRLSLPVGRGGRLAVVGESGSGTTTLATALVAGLPDTARVSGSVTYRPEAGDPVAVFELDDDALDRFRRETVAVVSGDAGGLDPTSTLRSQFRPALRSASADEDRVRELLSAVGLDPDRVLGASPRELNAGATQLARVVRGALTDPAVLVLDDLPVAFDSLARGDGLAALESAGTSDGAETTVVALGSDLPALSTLADRLAVLHDGHVVEAGPTERVLDDPSHPHTRTLVAFYSGGP